jgi:hypothetical protein
VPALATGIGDMRSMATPQVRMREPAKLDDNLIMFMDNSSPADTRAGQTGAAKNCAARDR